MKLLLIAFLLLLLRLTLQDKPSIHSLLCNKWQSIGSVTNGGKFNSTPIKKMAGTITINCDGSYTKEVTIYGDYIYKGNWLLSSDSKTILFSEKDFEIKQMPRQSRKRDTVIVTSKIILKLNSDTLILGEDQIRPSLNDTLHHAIYYVKIKE